MEEPAPLLTKAAASNEGRRGRRGWGEGQTPGSPHPSRDRPLPAATGVDKGPEGGELEAHPAEMKGSPPACGAARGGWGSPCAGYDPRLRP